MAADATKATLQNAFMRAFHTYKTFYLRFVYDSNRDEYKIIDQNFESQDPVLVVENKKVKLTQESSLEEFPRYLFARAALNDSNLSEQHKTLYRAITAHRIQNGKATRIPQMHELQEALSEARYEYKKAPKKDKALNLAQTILTSSSIGERQVRYSQLKKAELALNKVYQDFKGACQ